MQKRKRLLQRRLAQAVNKESRTYIADAINKDFKEGKFSFCASCGCQRFPSYWRVENMVSERYKCIPAKCLRRLYPSFPKDIRGEVVGLSLGTRSKRLLPSGGTLLQVDDYQDFMNSHRYLESQRYDYQCLNNQRSTYRVWRDSKENKLMFFGYHISFLHEQVFCDKSGRSWTCYTWQCSLESNPLLLCMEKTIPFLYKIKDSYFNLLPTELVDVIVNFVFDFCELEIRA